MKSLKLKKTISLICVIVLMMTVSSSAWAVELISDNSENASISEVVEDYLSELAYTMYMYEDNDLERNTVKEFPSLAEDGIAISTDSFKTQSSLGENLNLTSINPSIDYIVEKAEYFKTVRMEQMLYRENFSVNYQIEEINIAENTAQVFITENISFRYSDMDIDSFLSLLHEVYLYKHHNKWLVVDITTNDGFDVIHKNEDFDADTEIADFLESYTYESKGETTDLNLDNGSTVQSTVLSNRYYSPTNARNYAYTYTTQNSNNTQSFYNPLYPNYAGSGGDCVNFVSQCIYAGFYGSNDSTSINDNAFPQDTVGTSDADTKWYSNPSSIYWAWTHNTYLYDYFENSNSTTGTRVVATINSYTGSSSITVPSNLVGSIMQVPGTAGQYQHAIIITDDYGSARNNIYYCGHTGDAKNICLGDSWPNANIRVIMPTYASEAVECTSSSHTYSTISAVNGVDSICNYCGYCRIYIKNNLLAPVPVNSTQTLSATIGGGVTPYRSAMSVTAPNGNVSWLGEVNNSDSYSKTYTFNQTGLYTITLNTRDKNPSVSDSHVISNTYTVRVY
jgi:hypothetical protein